MMKSFFKKLSLVMALAMVVTMAAPAAQASAAEEASALGIALQEAKSKDEVKSIFNVGVDASVDLKYYGAPANYKELNPTWSSDNEKVATVDQKGNVTGAAEGVATITIALSDGTEGNAKVIVGPDYSDVALGVALQEAESKDDVVTEATVEVDETVDFKYYGAPAYYKQLNPTWSSDNEEVATVDQKGNVTGVADGVATITIALDNGQVGTLTVVVGKGEVTNAFVVKQTSDSKVELTFDNTAITAADLADLSFYYYVGETPINYPFKLDEVKDGVAKVTSYVSFTDGVKYGFKLGEESDEFTAVIGDVAAVIPSFNSDGDDNKAYAGKDTDINYKLVNAQGIDITASALANGGYVEFSFVEESADGEYWFSNPVDGVVWFDKEGASASVIIKYFTGKADEVTYENIVGAFTTITLVSEKPVAFAIDTAATPVVTLQKNSDGIDWNNASNVIALEDDAKGDTYKVVVKLKSNKGADVKTNELDPSIGTFTFASTNNAKLYVAEDGVIMTNAQGVTNVLVYFQANGASTKSVVAVVAVDVRAKRAVASMDLSTTNVIVSTKADYNTAEITVELKDQLGAGIGGNVEVNAVTKAPNGDNKKVPAYVITNNNTNKVTITVTGSVDNLPDAVNAYQYTFAVKCGNITKNFTVSVRRPDDNNISGYKLEFGGDSDIKTTDANVKAATATLYAMSNGVKNGVITLEGKKPDAATSATKGLYYYTVTRDGNALDITGTASALSIGLTKIESKDVNVNVASGTSLINLNLVKKDASGAGTYTVIIYQAVGSTNSASASSFRQVASGSVTVKDSQDTMSYVGKINNTTNATSLEEVVKNNFKFKLGGKEYAKSDDYGTTKISVNANVPAGGLANGAICFIKSVDFYVETGDNSNTYVKYTVNVNDYVEIK